MKTGYTDKQAERLMQKIETQAARACDEIASLHAIVPDTLVSPSYLQGEVIARSRQLQDIVRRRRRQR